MDAKTVAYVGEEIRWTKTGETPSHIAFTGCIMKDCKRNEGLIEVEITGTHIKNYHKK
jgi:hypothetical protein